MLDSSTGGTLCAWRRFMQLSLSFHAQVHLETRVGISFKALEVVLSDESPRHLVFYREKGRKREYRKEDNSFKRRGKKRKIVHKLFFCWSKCFWFVAVIDSLEGRIITLQPVCYSGKIHHILPEMFVKTLGLSIHQISFDRGGN